MLYDVGISFVQFDTSFLPNICQHFFCSPVTDEPGAWLHSHMKRLHSVVKSIVFGNVLVDVPVLVD